MILFISYPAIGHYTAMLPLARDYRSSGHRVAFTGIGSTRKWIEVNDLEYVAFDYLQTYFVSGWRSFLYLAWQHRRAGFAARRYREFMQFGQSLSALASASEVEMICLDVSLSAYYIFLPRDKVVRILNTSLSTTKSVGVPPMSCGMVFGRGLLWRVLAESMWRARYVRNLAAAWVSRVATRGQDERYFILRRLNGEKVFLPFYKGCFHYELDLDRVDVRVWILGAAMIEYPWKRLHAKEEYVDTEMLVPSKGGQRWKDLYGFMRNVTARRVLIYCALGSMTSRSREAGIRFIRKVLECVKRTGDCRLILSTGGLELSLFEGGDHVYMEKYLPQHAILPHCAAAIIHGGMNSVKECIFYRVPMLVYPFGFDQYGNAARIEYRGLGLKGNREWDSAAKMLRRLRVVCKIPKDRFYVKYDHERAVLTGGVG